MTNSIKNVTITILLAAYNGEAFIAQQIESILAQTWDNWRLIVQDDCSTDNTVKVVQEYCQKYPSKIVVLSRKTPSGSAQNNFISMLELVDSKYCMFCDQDDVWLPEKIEKTVEKMYQIEQIKGESTPILIHTDLVVVDDRLDLLFPSFFEMMNLSCKRDSFNNLLVQNIVTGCTMMINSHLLNLVSSNLESFSNNKILMHDWWFALVASAFGTIGFVESSTVMYRQHSNNTVGAKDAKSLNFIVKRLKSYKSIKETLNKTYDQAKEFLNVYSILMPLEYKKSCDIYATFPKYRKFVKLMYLCIYGFWKYGFIRKLAQCILI